MSDKESKAHFRPDIEGLRAVAIGAVLLFHAGIPAFSGGFIGVDVFFVISGFLITGLLLREWTSHGRIDLMAFYARRFRRLMPAALLVIVVTLVASYLILSELRFPGVAGDGAASAIYLANMRFAVNAIDYLGAEAAQSPYLHFWSLGVEEQFYLFWPLIIIVALRLLAIGRLGIAIAAIAAVSFWLALVWTDISAPWAFFSLPTRAWQLAVGALMAIGIIRLPRVMPDRLASAAVWLGLTIIGYGSVALGPETPYPGTAALIPVAGTVLVIIGGARSAVLPSRLLSLSGPRWIGRISYSLYLWHWPLLILVPIAVGVDDIAFNLVLVAVAVVLAALSTEFIEVPIRRGTLLPLSAPRSTTVALASSVVVAVVAVGAAALVIASQPVVPRLASGAGGIDAASLELPAPVRSGPVPANLSPALTQAYWDTPEGYRDGCHLDFAATAAPACAYAETDSATTVMLLGDSHAQQWLPALQRIATERDWRLVAVSKAGCPFIDAPVYNSALKRAYRECGTWNEHALELIETERPALVFVSSANMYELVGDQGERIEDGATEAWRAGLSSMLRQMADRAPEVIMLADTPRVGYEPAECLATSAGIEDCDASAERMLDPDYIELEATVAQEVGVRRISATEWLCGEQDCPLVMGDYLVYRDRHHLTATFAAVLAGKLGAALDDTLADG